MEHPMTSAIWTGANAASDIFLLVAAIVAGIEAIWLVMRETPEAALLPAALALVALGLLSL